MKKDDNFVRHLNNEKQGGIILKKINTGILVALLSLLFLAGCSPFALNVQTLSLKLGDTAQLATNSKDNEIVWASSDTSVLAVGNNGEIVTKGVGTAKVTATDSKDKIAECMVTVSHVYATAVEINESALEIEIGESAVLQANLLPDNVTAAEIDWSSSNPAVVAVSENGEVHGLVLGEAIVTASDINGISASCIVTVIPLPSITALSVERNLEMTVGDEKTLEVTILPDEHTEEILLWRSSNDTVATVDNGLIIAVSEGVTTISVETQDTHQKAQCEVSVKFAELVVDLNSGGYASMTMSTRGFRSTRGFNANAAASGGSGDYQYKFEVLNSKGNVIKKTGWQPESTYDIELSSGGTYTLRVSVMDSRGITVSASETATMS